MPTYQYLCTECGADLEVVQKFSDPSLTDCPQCQGRLRKVFNAVGVVFKGSGFYRTDSRSNGNGSDGAKSDGADSSGSGDGTGTGTGTKETAPANPGGSSSTSSSTKDSSSTASKGSSGPAAKTPAGTS